MIVFDLQCAAHAHVFEAWFGSSNDYETQRAGDMIMCPLCGDTQISKAVMAPHVGAKGNTLPSVSARSTMPVARSADSAPEMKTMLALMAQAQAALLEKSTWVGRAFADAARAMDAGDIAPASIYGEATPAEAKALIEDGIGIVPLPLPVTPPKQLN
jgi:hypothetical protein